MWRGEGGAVSTCVRSIRIPAANAAARSLPDLLCLICIGDGHVVTSDPPHPHLLTLKMIINDRPTLIAIKFEVKCN